MATFRRFEDIDAWKVGRELTQAIYHASRHGAFATDFALRDQIRRAAISTTSNEDRQTDELPPAIAQHLTCDLQTCDLLTCLLCF